MAHYQDATARQLDFGYEVASSSERPSGEKGDHQLCEMCGRVEAHLYIPAAHGQQPAAVCLRCHHAVRQQKRMLRASIKQAAGAPAPSRLIASPAGEGPASHQRSPSRPTDDLYKELEHRRRRAQVAARKALGE